MKNQKQGETLTIRLGKSMTGRRRIEFPLPPCLYYHIQVWINNIQNHLKCQVQCTAYLLRKTVSHIKKQRLLSGYTNHTYVVHCPCVSKKI